MSAPVTVVTNLPKKALEALLALGTPKLMLATDTYVPNQDTLDYVNDVTNEATGTSYSAGGITLTSVAVNLDTATNKVSITAANVAPAGLSVSCRWGVIYVSTGTTSTSPVVAYVDFSQALGGNVTFTGVNWDALGVAAWTVV